MKGSTRSTAAMMAVAALFAALRWPDGEAPQQAGWKLLATSPYLTVNDGLLNADEVSQLLDMASEQDMAPCTGNWKAGSYEDTRSCGLLPIGNNSLLLSLRAKLGTELGVDVSDLTHLPLRLSAPGTPAVPLHNEYRTLDGAPGAAAADVHPYAVALMYLQNGAPEGSGRLNFPLSGISIEAKPGALVFFRVLNDAGELCPYHAHAVDSYPANSTSDKLVITISFDAPSGQGAASMLRAQPLFSQQGRAEQRELLFGSKVEKTEGTAVGSGINHWAGQHWAGQHLSKSLQGVISQPLFSLQGRAEQRELLN